MKKKPQRQSSSESPSFAANLARMPHSTEEEIQRIADYVSGAIVGQGVSVTDLGSDFQSAGGSGGFSAEPQFQDFVTAVASGDMDSIRRILREAGLGVHEIEDFISSRSTRADHGDSDSDSERRGRDTPDT